MTTGPLPAPIPVRRAYADGDHGQMHYRIAGPREDAGRPPLVCLHQTPKSGRDYERLIGVLGEARVCIAPDTPGYGDSDAPETPPSIADYGAALLGLIDGLQGKGMLSEGPVDLMGYHTGGVIAAWIARHHPDRVRRVIFVSLAALDAAVRAERLANMHVFPVPGADGSAIQSLWSLTETLNDARLDPEWRQVALAECLRSGARMPWGFRAVFDHDMQDDLKALHQPALILCPRDDLWDETHAGMPLLADARLVEFPEAGNGFLDLDTVEIAGLLSDFLNEA